MARGARCSHSAVIGRWCHRTSEQKDSVNSDRKLDTRREFLRAIDSLCRFLVVRRCRFKNIRCILLRIAVDDREPRALHLHHDPMSFQEDMVVRVKVIPFE